MTGETLLKNATRERTVWAQLDTLRLLLALVVFVAHFCQIFLFSTGVINRAEMDIPSHASRIAVLGFFTISGLVIGRSLLDKSSRNPNGFVFEFALRRFARIYPPLLFAVALCLMLWGILKLLGLDIYVGSAGIPARTSYEYRVTQVAVALGTFGIEGELTGVVNGPLWSLQHEMKLYVISALLFWAYFATRIFVKVSATVMTIALAGRIAPQINMEISYYYMAFAAGIALNFAPTRWAPTTLFLPTARHDFSYSLFILHFPIMLFFFFLFQHYPSYLIYAAIASAAVAVVVSFWASQVFESRTRLLAIVDYLSRIRIQTLNARGALPAQKGE